MNFLDTFDQLNKITESAGTDEYWQIGQEIDQLTAEIRDLQNEYDQGWQDTYNKNLATAKKELDDLEKEIHKLESTYTYIARTLYDDEGHFDMYEYGEDPEKKALVAEKETELRNKLEKLKTAYKKLEQECKAEYQTASAPHTAEMETRKQDIKTKKEHRKATLAKIIEGVRPELEELLKKIADESVSINWQNIKLEKNTLRVPLVYEDTLELSIEDYHLDMGDPYVNLDDLESDLENVIPEIAGDIVASLDFEEAEIYPWLEAKGIKQIPGTDWEIDIDPLIDIEEPYCSSGSWSGDGWYEPREFDFDYDSETNYYLTFYLYRNL